MHTTDNQAENDQNNNGLFDGMDNGGAVDNDAYGQPEQQQKPDTTDEENDGSDDDDQGEEGGKQPPESTEDEEEEFYWDGEALASPTSTTDDGADSDTPLVKQLRQTIKDQRAKMRDMGVQAPTAQQQAAAPATLPPYPTMADEGIDYDPDIFQAKVKEWHETEARVKAQTEQQQRAQSELQSRFDERKTAYKDRVASLKIRGYEDAEEFVAGEVSREIQTALILHAERPEFVVLALARNPDLLKKAKEITNPVELGVLIGKVEAKAKALPKGKSTAKGAPANPRGGGNGQIRDLDAELDKARNSGDYTRVIQLQKQKAAAAKK